MDYFPEAVHFPEAVNALAFLCPQNRSSEPSEEERLLLQLLQAPSVRKYIRRCKAAQALRFLQAICFLFVRHEPGSAGEKNLVKLVDSGLWTMLLDSTTLRFGRQLMLPQRRELLNALELVGDLSDRYDLGIGSATISMKRLPVTALPPVIGTLEDTGDDWVSVEVGAQALMQHLPTAEPQKGVHFLNHGDTFVSAKGSYGIDNLTPGCRLMLRAIELQGWRAELRA